VTVAEHQTQEAHRISQCCLEMVTVAERQTREAQGIPACVVHAAQIVMFGERQQRDRGFIVRAPWMSGGGSKLNIGGIALHTSDGC
jgi:hypothetical protein